MCDQAEAAVQRALAALRESFITATGPGGQNVNKVANAVQLRVSLFALRLTPPVFAHLRLLGGSRVTGGGELVLIARRFRTQEANRADARERLIALIEAAHDLPAARGKSRVNRTDKHARLGAKKIRGTIKAARAKVPLD